MGRNFHVMFNSNPENHYSAYPDEMPHFAAFYLGFHSFPKYADPEGVGAGGLDPHPQEK